MTQLTFSRIILISILLTVILNPSPPAIAGPEWQYWNEFILHKSFIPNIDLHMGVEQRIVDDFSNFGLYNFSPGFKIQLNPHFEFVLTYRNEKEKEDETWIQEHRLELIPAIKWAMSDFHFKLRSRTEYRLVDGAKRWRLRKKFNIYKLISIGEFEIEPFAAEEVFYDFSVDKLNKNRVTVGFMKVVSKRCELGIYYLYQSRFSAERWKHNHVLGTEINLIFN